MRVIADLAARRATGCRTAVVVAHPDDETIAAGGSLLLLPNLLLVHVTDGAPRDGRDAQAHGFGTAEAYAAAREMELRAALALAGVAPQRLRLDVPDQEAWQNVPAIVSQLQRAFAAHGTEAVITHAYEGGHPDHDTVALAVHLAGKGLPIVEFAGYHAGPEAEMTVQRFLPGPAETRVTLDPEESARKRAMLDCFRTQAGILGRFGTSVERFRPAPRYDFAAAPHEGALNYENWGWPITGAAWRAMAREMLACAR